MINQFCIEWEKEKKAIVERGYREIYISVGVAVILLLSPTIISTFFQEEIWLLIRYFFNGLPLLPSVWALAVFNSLRAFKKEATGQATRIGYEKLLELCIKAPRTGDQCREAVAEILARQGFLTQWQIDWMAEHLTLLGDRECVETLKTKFFTKN